MKRTVYFISNFRSSTSFEQSVQEAEKKRDDFLEKNSNEISEIDSENIQAVYTSSHQSLGVIITLSYYPNK